MKERTQIKTNPLSLFLTQIPLHSAHSAHVGESEYQTFQLILSHPHESFTYPLAFPSAAKDLCEKLLLQDAGARLGAGRPGGDNGFRVLQCHDFFHVR